VLGLSGRLTIVPEWTAFDSEKIDFCCDARIARTVDFYDNLLTDNRGLVPAAKGQNFDLCLPAFNSERQAAGQFPSREVVRLIDDAHVLGRL
jgi:hypothetical protein